MRLYAQDWKTVNSSNVHTAGSILIATVIVTLLAVMASTIFTAAELSDKMTACDWAYRKAETAAIATANNAGIINSRTYLLTESLAYSNLYLACVERIKP